MKRRELYQELVLKELEIIHFRMVELIRKVELMSQQLDALKVQVERTKTVAQSAVTLINGLAQQIADLKDDPVQLQKLSDDLKAQADALSAAVSANTPTPPAPPVA